MAVDFPKLIGWFIHQCGALELLTNNSIKAFAKDPLLLSEVIKSSWSKRINLLRKLLQVRSNLNKDDIEALCDELNEIREKRNLVAHNPILSTKPDGSGKEEILIIRYKADKIEDIEKITKQDVAILVQQTKKLIKKFADLVPNSTKN